MDSTDLDNALQQIGMLSESAVVVDDRGQRKPSKGVTSPSKPAQQQTHASPHTRTPLSTTAARRRKGKHRKPKPNLQQPSTTTKNLNVENSTSEEGSDDEYFYPPLKPTQREKEDNGEIDTDSDQDNDDEDGGNDQFDEYELQLAMQMSAMVNRAEGVELVSEQYKYRANIYTRQHVLVQLDEDKGTQRPDTEGHVWEVLTTEDFHPKGIKVRLMSGDTGRVRSIFGDMGNHNTNQQNNTSETTKSKNSNNTTTPNVEIVDCPVGCGMKVELVEMNRHVDECLTQQYINNNIKN